jgi:hypothetical protein
MDLSRYYHLLRRDNSRRFCRRRPVIQRSYGIRKHHMNPTIPGTECGT